MEALALGLDFAAIADIEAEGDDQVAIEIKPGFIFPSQIPVPVPR